MVMAPSQPDGGPRGHGPRGRRGVGRDVEAFDAAAANTEMAEKLRRNDLRRRARGHGLELRHTDYGYALIDSVRNRVGGRNDLTLDEVAAHLDLTAPA
jgi:hypothetical protein